MTSTNRRSARFTSGRHAVIHCWRVPSVKATRRITTDIVRVAHDQRPSPRTNADVAQSVDVVCGRLIVRPSGRITRRDWAPSPCFEIGSISKVFTALSAHRLVGQGTWRRRPSRSWCHRFRPHGLCVSGNGWHSRTDVAPPPRHSATSSGARTQRMRLKLGE